jgi:hypothetical protein
MSSGGNMKLDNIGQGASGGNMKLDIIGKEPRRNMNWIYWTRNSGGNMKLDYWQGASGGNKYEQIFYNYYQD